MGEMEKRFTVWIYSSHWFMGIFSVRASDRSICRNTQLGMGRNTQFRKGGREWNNGIVEYWNDGDGIIREWNDGILE
jgi:hypothetical protein